MTKSICIITGSTLGGAEYVADHLNDLLQQQGFNTLLFNQADLADIKDQSYLLVVTSTHGAGELPDNIKALFDEIAKQTIDFSQLKFAVVGLGSSDYDTFCQAVDIVESILISNKAQQLCPSLRIDVTQDFDPDMTAENWLPLFIQAIK